MVSRNQRFWSSRIALPSTSVWEIRTAGLDTNGGGFDSAGSGTDYSQQDTKNTVGNNISVTDVVTAGSTTITSLTASFTAAITGNIVYLAGGTGSVAAGWYRLTFVNSTTCTTDRSSGLTAGTGVTMNVGGALLTAATVNTNAVAGNTVYVKAGSYTFTAAVAFNKDSRSLTPYKWIGYTTTRTDNGRATFATATNSIAIISITGTCVNVEIDNISFTNTAGTRGPGIQAGTTGFMWVIRNCIFDGFSIAIDDNSNNFQPLLVAQCEIKNCTSHGLSNGSSTFVDDCFIHNNAGIGIRALSNAGSGGNSAVTVINTIVYANTLQGMVVSAGSVNGSYTQTVIRSSAFVGNTSDGLRVTVGGSNDAGFSSKNSIYYGNGGYGINVTAANQLMMLYFLYNAFGANVTAALLNVSAGVGDVALSGDPFTNAAGGDFSLNSTGGAGAACKGIGFPGALPAGGTGFADIGPLQSNGSVTVTNNIIVRNSTIVVSGE